MTDPIDYLVIRHLQAALQAMTIAGGFYHDVAGMAVKLDPNHAVDTLIAPDGPRPFVILELKPETWTYQPANELRLVMPVTIHWVGESTPTVDESRMQTYLRGCADVERAITRDISRGGRAVDTRIVKRTCDESTSGSQVWAIVDIEIRLYRVFGQP